MNIVQKPVSPNNYSEGRQGQRPDLIVIHVTQGGKGAVARWFDNPRAQVSAHYLVTQAGEIWQFVDEVDTAYHAGDFEINLRSIGLEHEGVGANYVPNEVQLAASVKLAEDICERWNLAPRQAVKPHRAFRATRCPADFPMERYISMVEQEMQEEVNGEQNETVRIFDPRTNEQIGTGTRIAGTDKVYLKTLEITFKPEGSAP